jgi:nucleoside-diphosphate-sugar epimerase
MWIGDFADALLDGQAFLVGGGEGLCNAVYVDNLVHAIELAAGVAKADGEALLIGENGNVSWRDFYAPIVAALGRDLSEVASVEFESVSRSLKERIDAARLSGPVQAVLQALPTSLRSVVGAAWKASGALPEALPLRPRPTLETALLHRSRYCPPWTKARHVLGYEPIVSREEAYRRTIGWLTFAGYPVQGRNA